MDLNKLLGMEDELPELKDQDFPDDEQRLYRSFLDKAKNDKISLPLIYSEQFKNLKHLKKNPKMLESIKKHIQDQFDKNPSKSKGKTQQVVINGEQFLEKIPFAFFIPQSSRVHLINKLAQKNNTIRQLIYDLLPLYEDDVVQLVIKLHGQSYVNVKGKIEELFVATDDFMKIPADENKLDMMTVEIKLLSSGDFRRRHEEKSNIFDTTKEKEKLLSKEYQMEVFSKNIKKKTMPPDQIVERGRLFNLELTENPESWEDLSNLTPTDFNSKRMSDLRDVEISFSHLGTNTDLLKFKLRLDLELKKMEKWLNRDKPDGKDGYFK